MHKFIENKTDYMLFNKPKQSTFWKHKFTMNSNNSKQKF